MTLPSGHGETEELISKEKAEFSIPVKSVSETGAVVTLSSDWDVSDVNPFVGMQHATERGKQSVSVKTAVEMYTINAAYAMRQEYQVGSLVKGNDMLAFILNKEPEHDKNIKLTCAPSEDSDHRRHLHSLIGVFTIHSA